MVRCCAYAPGRRNPATAAGRAGLPAFALMRAGAPRSPRRPLPCGIGGVWCALQPNTDSKNSILSEIGDMRPFAGARWKLARRAPSAAEHVPANISP